MFDFSFFAETSQVNNTWLIILTIVFIITSLGGLIASITTLCFYIKRKVTQITYYIRLVKDNSRELDDVIRHLDGTKVHYYDHTRVEFPRKGKK